MRLVTFRQNDKTRIGIQTHEGVIDLSIAAPNLPKNMLSFLAAGTSAMQASQSVENSDIHHSMDEVRLQCPITVPPMILAIGLNYPLYAEETGPALPKVPLFFTKQQACANGPFDDIHAPPE